MQVENVMDLKAGFAAELWTYTHNINMMKVYTHDTF